MTEIESGDLVTKRGEQISMLVIGAADENPCAPISTVFCVWESDNLLYEEVYAVADLEVVRKERRRIIRGGNLCFPTM
jgi:hypothetical protein